eukprot:4627651-Pyramimonas_sp.AAC.1
MRACCHRFQVTAPSTFIPAPPGDPHHTHARTNGKTKKRLDYVLIPQDWLRAVKQAQVDHTVDLANVVEDHSPTFVSVGVPSGSLDVYQYR